jgi:hypothetical protein
VAGRGSMVAVQLYTAHKKNKRTKEQAERRVLQSVFRSCTASPYSETSFTGGSPGRGSGH